MYLNTQVVFGQYFKGSDILKLLGNLALRLYEFMITMHFARLFCTLFSDILSYLVSF